MRRHMFVNSRRTGAQTTVDHLGIFGNKATGGQCDSLVSYDGGFMVSASFASNSNVSYKEPPQQQPPTTTSFVKPVTNQTTPITTTKVETINECANKVGFHQ